MSNKTYGDINANYGSSNISYDGGDIVVVSPVTLTLSVTVHVPGFTISSSVTTSTHVLSLLLSDPTAQISYPKPAWKKGTAVINYGASGRGLIYMTASDLNSPHIDVLTHAGEPWNLVTTHMRMGNVNGFLDAVTDLYGIYIGNTNAYLKYDPTNGLQIKGSITITGGNASVTFYQDIAPGSSGDSNIPKNGDYWVDTDDDNKLYTYQSGIWELIKSGDDGWLIWRHASDTTKIDGGTIYTKTILADSISVDNLEAVSANTGTLSVDEIIRVYGDTLTIATGVNDKIDWLEGATTRAATLTAATNYTPATLAAEVQTQMRAGAGDDNTTVTYSSTTKKITIANSTVGTLTLKWATGTNTLVNCGKTLGFKVDADDSEALTYTADYPTALRIEIGELV